MKSVFAAALLAFSPVSAWAPSNAAARQIASIGSTLRHCKESLGEYPSTTEIQNCDFNAWKAARKLVPKSKGNAALDKLWPDIFGNLVYYLAGSDALAMRVVVASEGTDFELKRAAILTGAKRSEPKRRYSDDELLRLLKAVRADDNSPGAKTSLADWKAVRDADCAAYPVTNCSARLNAAFGLFIAAIISMKS